LGHASLILCILLFLLLLKEIDPRNSPDPSYMDLARVSIPSYLGVAMAPGPSNVGLGRPDPRNLGLTRPHFRR